MRTWHSLKVPYQSTIQVLGTYFIKIPNALSVWILATYCIALRMIAGAELEN